MSMNTPETRLNQTSPQAQKTEQNPENWPSIREYLYSCNKSPDDFE